MGGDDNVFISTMRYPYSNVHSRIKRDFPKPITLKQKVEEER
jgi:hypothetical protein